MAPRKKTKKPRAPAVFGHYLAAWADDADQSARHLCDVLIDALCALKRLQVQGELDAYPEWKGEGSAMVQLGLPAGADAKLLKAHPFLPPQTPLMVVTGSQELTSLMVGFSRGVSTRWRKRIVTGKSKGPAKLPRVMLVAGGDLVVAEGSVFAEQRQMLEEAGWKVRALGPSDLAPD